MQQLLRAIGHTRGNSDRPPARLEIDAVIANEGSIQIEKYMTVLFHAFNTLILMNLIIDTNISFYL